MDIRFLVKKGVIEALGFLGEAEGNSALSSELKEMTGIKRRKLRFLVDQGILEKSDERVVVKTVPVKRKRTAYGISAMGKRLLELFESLSEKEAKTFLKTSRRQLDILRFFLKAGPKRPRDVLPDIQSATLTRLSERGLLDRKNVMVEETIDIVGLKRTYTLTEKGKKVYTAYKTIASL